MWLGDNALNILKNLPNLKKLILIDPYLPYVDGDINNKTVTVPPRAEVAAQKLAKYADKLEWRFFKSLDAAKLFHAEELDFVYIDGDHTYENVKAELDAYWPLIKRGGVMGGHDINFYGVMRAVGEFAQENQLHPRTDEQDWWIVKK